MLKVKCCKFKGRRVRFPRCTRSRIKAKKLKKQPLPDWWEGLKLQAFEPEDLLVTKVSFYAAGILLKRL